MEDTQESFEKWLKRRGLNTEKLTPCKNGKPKYKSSHIDAMYRGWDAAIEEMNNDDETIPNHNSSNIRSWSV